MALALREPNQAAGGEISQQTAKTAGGGFVSLPFPANIRGKVFYLRMSTTTPIQIRITQEASGASVIPNVLGSILVEYDVADRVTGVEIDGAATFEWVVFGDSI